MEGTNTTDRASGVPICFERVDHVYSTLHIQKTRSNFCETSIQLRNNSLVATDVETRKHLLIARQCQRERTLAEYKSYRDICFCIVKNPSTSELHRTSGFAEENIILPLLLRQTAQLHFITGLKYELFDDASSNLNKVFLFWLPKGHWTNAKTSNEFLSIAEAACKYPSVPLATCNQLDTL